jgi:small-conductance mechanosensitive channel
MSTHVSFLGRLREYLPDELTNLDALGALVVLSVGVVVGILLGQLLRRLLEAAGVPGAVEGTAFERTAQGLGLSTVSILSRLPAWVIYGVSVLFAISIVQPTGTTWIQSFVVEFVIKRVFIATIVLIVGFLVADKAELLFSERLRSVKLPEVTILPLAVKYSIIYIALLMALNHIGVNATALLVMLAVYLSGVIFLAGIATRDLLASGTAGVYLLLNQPYAIGDTVSIGDREGVVQEVDIFVTRLETDEKEFLVPNRKIFEHGVIRDRTK